MGMLLQGREKILRYYSGLWPSKIQSHPVKSYSLVFNEKGLEIEMF